MAANIEGAESPILIVRLGAMGDIIHALPAVASLKLSFPLRRLVWAVARKWMPLLEGNPAIDAALPYERRPLSQLAATVRRLRAVKAALAIDFQGLIQSALVARAACPGQIIGLHRTLAREPLASLFYTLRVPAAGPHRVERCLQLVAAAGAQKLTGEAWIPSGVIEGDLPRGPFVLASPFAGWSGKQWPLASYEVLAARLQKEGLTLVANVPESRAREVSNLKNVQLHILSLPGLIYATRQAAAVIGVDSGPLHLAAALHKPGVALYGPTDPAQTGPFKSRMVVLREKSATTTYKRGEAIHSSMAAIDAQQVADALLQSLASNRVQVSS